MLNSSFLVLNRGYGCAMPTFPGVYSRISDQIDWIQSTICQISSKPPPEIDCSQVSSPGGIARAVPVTIILQFDDYPAETGWSIKNKESDTKLVEVPAGTYEVAQALTPETVFLPVGETYIFEIQDTFGDGLCCSTSGNYVVILGRNPDGEVLVAVRLLSRSYLCFEAQFDAQSNARPIILCFLFFRFSSSIIRVEAILVSVRNTNFMSLKIMKSRVKVLQDR